MSTCLALDLALHTGYALARWEPREQLLKLPPRPGQMVGVETRTRISILECGLLNFDVLKRVTVAGEGERFCVAEFLLRELIGRVQPEVVAFESAVTQTWLRGKRRTGQSIATLAGLRGMAVLAAVKEGYRGAQVVEVNPTEWQGALLGRGNRELLKAKSMAAAWARYGIQAESDDVADACHQAAYVLAKMNNGRA